MIPRDVVLVGGSAGALPALLEVAGSLPAKLEAGVLVVLHTSPDRRGYLPELLSNAGALPATHAVDGEPFRHRHVFIAPADRHLILNDGTLHVMHGPREHGFRPAVDPLFRTAAETLGSRVIGVILSGGLADGALGLHEVKRHGGIAIVQDVDEALVPAMPLNAIRTVEVDHVLRASQIGPTIARLARRGGRVRARHRRRPSTEERRLTEGARPPVAFTCPECGGALAERKNGKIVSFRCHTGHLFTSESLDAEQSDGVEEAFWSAMRALQEAAALRRRMAEQTRAGRLHALAHAYERRAEEADQQAALIRRVLVNGGPNEHDDQEKPRRAGRRRRAEKSE